jgi:DNA polymerase III alpha subunit (gram-positive type)
MKLILQGEAMNLKPSKYMVFDVESIGLHGEAFAVAWCIVKDGKIESERCLSCDRDSCYGSDIDRDWVDEYVPMIKITHEHRKDMLNEFWQEWVKQSSEGAALVADCCWPVETNFLSDCVRRHLSERKWQGPYPLLDLTSMFFAHNLNWIATGFDLHEHHPLRDARVSAATLIELLERHPFIGT